jgi:hypothetical protein
LEVAAVPDLSMGSQASVRREHEYGVLGEGHPLPVVDLLVGGDDAWVTLLRLIGGA